MHRLKFDNDTLRKVTKLVYYHDYRMPAQARNVRRAMNKIGEDLFPYYLKVRRADTDAQSDYQKEEKYANLDGIEALYAEILKKHQCVSLKELAVTGKDLIDAGVKSGPAIGELLDELLKDVIEYPEHNEKTYLLQIVKKKMGTVL